MAEHIQKTRRRLGLCPYCGQEPVPGRTMCAEHLASASRRSAEYQRLNGYKQNRRQRENRQQWWRAQKEGKACVYCGEDNPVCLHFHHRNPAEKSFNIARDYSRKLITEEQALAEIAKCDLLCANCHAKLHYGGTEWQG